MERYFRILPIKVASSIALFGTRCLRGFGSSRVTFVKLPRGDELDVSTLYEISSG